MRFHTYFDDDCSPAHRPEERLVIVGPVRELPAGPVPKTPQYRRWPLFVGEITMAFQLTATQQVDLTIAATDRRGNPAPVDGVPEWATDNSDVLALVPSADGMTCTVKATGVLGTGRVQMTADADRTDGVRQIIGTLDIEVVAGDAVQVALTPGAPTEQPDGE